MNFASIKRRLSRLRWPFRRSNGNLLLGLRGERAATRYLKRRHHKIIARNYCCSAGEIDVISADGDTIVFVEVKSRSSSDAQDPQETIGRAKWTRVERAARYYLMRHSVVDHPCRFDFVTVVWAPHGGPMIEHFENAYQPRSL